MEHTFKIGDVVTVINRAKGMRGATGFLIEGRATILRLLDADEYYKVRFVDDEQRLGRRAFDRFVDPAAQADPRGFVQRLNVQMEAMA